MLLRTKFCVCRHKNSLWTERCLLWSIHYAAVNMKRWLEKGILYDKFWIGIESNGTILTDGDEWSVRLGWCNGAERDGRETCLLGEPWAPRPTWFVFPWASEETGGFSSDDFSLVCSSSCNSCNERRWRRMSNFFCKMLYENEKFITRSLTVKILKQCLKEWCSKNTLVTNNKFVPSGDMCMPWPTFVYF